MSGIQSPAGSGRRSGRVGRGHARRCAGAANDAAGVIAKFTGGKKPTEGKVKLDLPEIAENGNTVPMTVTVESPMSEQSHVTRCWSSATATRAPAWRRPTSRRARGVAEANTRCASRRRRTSRRSRR